MKRALLVALSILIAAPAFAETVPPKKYGTATTIDFQLYQTSGLELKTDATCASGDVKIMIDEGSETNATNCFSDEGQGYSIALTSGEMTGKRIVIYVVDQGTKQWIDKAITLETFGDASAAQQFDLDSPTVSISSGGIPADANVADGTAQSGTSSTIVLASATSFADDILNGRTICIVGGTGGGQCRTITNYTGSSDTADISPNWTTNPSSDSEYVIGSGPVTIASNLDKTGYALTQTFPTNFSSMGIAAGGEVVSNVTQWNGSNVLSPDISGAPKVTISSGTGTGQLSLSSGTVTVGTNNDKTNYTLSAASLATFFTTDTTKTFTDAVAGSVVKEIADNAAGGGGGSCSASDIRNALLDGAAGLSFHDCADGSYCFAAGERTVNAVNDLLQGTAGNDFIATDSPLSFGGTDYTDSNFGVTGDYYVLLQSADPTGCTNDSCRITGITAADNVDLDVALVTENYTGGGGCGTLHQTILTTRGTFGDNCAAFASALEGALSGAGGPCTLSSLTCENFKQSYFTANGAANYTFNGFTGFENGGTVAVTGAKTTPPTVTYSPLPPTLANVNVQQWNGAIVATPNTDGVPLVEVQTNGDKTGYSVSALGNDVITGNSIDSTADTEIENTIWNATQSGHTTTGTTGKSLSDAAAGGGGGGATVDEIWNEPLSSHSGVAGSMAEALSNAGSGGVSPTRRW